ncbi:MAG: enoyl-CoA hydratase/isomerase family protein [Phycisphaerae bacterium]
MPELIRQVTEGGVDIVTLARPELHNAFNEVVIAELTEAFLDVGRDEGVRAVVLAGEGRSFCAGADVHWMKRMVGYSFEENVADANAMANMLRAIRECPKPVIARVHGAAIGGGVGLVAACDLAVAVESAVFCLSEVALGIVPAVISPFVMEKIGPGHLRRYALTAERFDAAQAQRIGLICDMVPDEAGLNPWIDRVVQAIQATGPEAVAHCKRVLQQAAGFDWDAVQQMTTGKIAERRVSAEGQEGLRAFLEKRKPRWVTGKRPAGEAPAAT